MLVHPQVLRGRLPAPRSLDLSNASLSDCPGSRLGWSTGSGWLPLRGCCGECAEGTSTWSSVRWTRLWRTPSRWVLRAAGNCVLSVLGPSSWRRGGGVILWSRVFTSVKLIAIAFLFPGFSLPPIFVKKKKSIKGQFKDWLLWIPYIAVNTPQLFMLPRRSCTWKLSSAPAPWGGRWVFLTKS